MDLVITGWLHLDDACCLEVYLCVSDVCFGMAVTPFVRLLLLVHLLHRSRSGSSNITVRLHKFVPLDILLNAFIWRYSSKHSLRSHVILQE